MLLNLKSIQFENEYRFMLGKNVFKEGLLLLITRYTEVIHPQDNSDKQNWSVTWGCQLAP